jgi:hypothetical protein
MKKYIGYTSETEIPVKQGDKVLIKKGTEIRTSQGDIHFAKRTYTVRVHNILKGMNSSEGKPLINPSIRWPGAGGYWNQVDINDILEKS